MVTRRAAGDFADAASLLHALDGLGRPLKDVGISGYPEGHAHIPEEVLQEALREKSPFASRIVTQMCFSAEVITGWAHDLRTRGIPTPVVIGTPGPVGRQKLVRISAGIGLGQSARFLTKQQGLVRRFLTPEGFNPNRLLRDLAAALPDVETNISGLRMFTFNEIAGTEAWRRQVVEMLPGGTGEPVPPLERASAQ